MELLQKENRPSFENLNEYITNINCIDNKSIFINQDEIPKKIVAIGDIHGDLEALFKILLDSTIIDISGLWIAQDTFLIITGDIFDRGRQLNTMIRTATHVPITIIKNNGETVLLDNKTNLKDTVFSYGNPGDELVIIKFLTDLNIQSNRSEFGNSRVMLCCGNHEYWYSDPIWLSRNDLIYDGNYFHPDDFVVFGSKKNRNQLMNPGGLLSIKFACILKAVVIVGDCIFMHGGLNIQSLSNYIKNIHDFDKINEMLKRHFLNTSLQDDNKFILHNIFNDRNLGDSKNIILNCQNYLKFIEDILQIKNLNLIIGHTPQKSCNGNSVPIDKFLPNVIKEDGTVEPCITLPTVWCNNQIYRIDTLISRMNGTLDYRSPNLGNLNSLIIELNENGTKKNVLVMNSYILNSTGYLTKAIEQ
jgi:hypothetical protein